MQNVPNNLRSMEQIAFLGRAFSTCMVWVVTNWEFDVGVQILCLKHKDTNLYLIC